MTEQTSTSHEDIDMTVVQRVFEKAGNAIVDASRLAKAVQELETRVNGLISDVDFLRDRNKYLDEQLGYLRKARDEAESKASHLEQQLAETTMALTNEKEMRQQTMANYNAMTDRWQAASKERDDAMLREMELQDRLKEAEGKLAEIRKALGWVETTPEQPKVVEPEVKQVDPPQFGGPPSEQVETTEERERREAQSRDVAGRFGPKVVGSDWGF